MYPVLFEAVGVKVHSYGAMLAIGFIVATWIARGRAVRAGLPPNSIFDAGMVALFLGVIGARLFFILQDLPHYLQEPRRIIDEGFQGLTSFGGVAFGALGLYLWSRFTKTSFIKVLDVAGVPFLIAHAIGRIGCLLNGCCYGGACDLPWGVEQAGALGRVHPAQVYDGLLNVAAALVIIQIERRGRLKLGQSIGIVLIAHGAARFVYEFWRAGSTSTTISGLPITQGHVAALVVAAIGLAIYWRRGVLAHHADAKLVS